MLIKLPVEVIYKDVHLNVLGSIKDSEHMCLPCLGQEYDDIEEGRYEFAK